MSTVFENMDRLAAERFPEPLESTFDMLPRNMQPIEDLPDAEVVEVEQRRETSDADAVGDKTDYRYDLIPRIVATRLLNEHPAAQCVCTALLYGHKRPNLPVIDALAELVGTDRAGLAHLYAQALHERASKHDERHWEQGKSESNLLNHALYHLFQLVSGDQSENHKSHLVGNVLTFLYLRGQSMDREGGGQS